MERLAVILEVISSGCKIDIVKLESYCQVTAKMYVELYPWYPLTPTLHKILIHGPKVIRHAILPIGALSEEAAEARNKHFRKFSNTQKKMSYGLYVIWMSLIDYY